MSLYNVMMCVMLLFKLQEAFMLCIITRDVRVLRPHQAIYARLVGSRCVTNTNANSSVLHTLYL